MLKDVSVVKIYMYANTVYFVNNLQNVDLLLHEKD